MDFLNTLRQMRFLNPQEEQEGIGVNIPYNTFSPNYNQEEELPQVDYSEDSPTIPEQSQGNQGLALLQNLYQRPSPALEAYKQHIQVMPQEQDYKPGFKGNLAGIMAGAGATLQGRDSYAATKNAKNAGYTNALSAYQSKGKNLAELADIEAKDTGDRIRSATAFANYGDRDVKNDLANRRQNTTDELTKAKIAKLQDDINKGIKRVEKGADGITYVIDLKNNTRSAIDGQVQQSIAEKNAQAIALLDIKDQFLGKRQERNINLRGDRADKSSLFGNGLKRGNMQAQHDLDVDRDAKRIETTSKVKANFAGQDKTPTAGAELQANRLALSQYLRDNPQHQKFFESNGLPSSAARNDDPEYRKAIEDIRNRINTIKARSGKKTPLSAPPKEEVKDPDKEVKELLKNHKDGSFTLSDGSKWTKKGSSIERVK